MTGTRPHAQRPTSDRTRAVSAADRIAALAEVNPVYAARLTAVLGRIEDADLSRAEIIRRLGRLAPSKVDHARHVLDGRTVSARLVGEVEAVLTAAGA